MGYDSISMVPMSQKNEMVISVQMPLQNRGQAPMLLQMCQLWSVLADLASRDDRARVPETWSITLLGRWPVSILHLIFLGVDFKLGDKLTLGNESLIGWRA